MEIRQKPMGSFTKEKEQVFISKQMKQKPVTSFKDMLKKEIDIAEKRKV